jgi:RHS repeat-associated protein
MEPTYKKQRREKLRQAKQRPQPRDCTRLDDDGDGHAEQRRIFIYDGNQIVMDFWRTNSGDMQVGHLRQRYLWGPAVDQILAEEAVDGGTPDLVQWTLTDHLNTVRDIAKYDPGSDMTTAVNHLIYDAFGRVTSESNPTIDSLFLFTGRPFDSDTRLQNNLNRWYDASVGRWLSEDPIGFAGGDGNLYRYVGNKPLASLDPSGEDRRILTWCGHAILEIRNCATGDVFWLEFSPEGYTISRPYSTNVIAVTGWLKTTPRQDETLIQLWRLLELERRQGEVASWNPLWNCWGPVLLYFHYAAR